jgi:hypothetical protein
MSAIFAKLACFGSTRMEGKELHYYFNLLINELKTPVVSFIPLRIAYFYLYLE